MSKTSMGWFLDLVQRGQPITGRFFTRFLTILKEEPPGPIMIPALIAVNGVALAPKVFSTSYRDNK